jgi:dihydroflavonol-4-reductase
VIVNPSVIIGERDIRFHGGQLIRDIAKGRVLFSVRGGMNIVYAGDVARGMILAAARGRTGERYILAGENLTHKEIFIRTAALVGGRRPLATLPPSVLRGIGRSVEIASRLVGVEPLFTADLAALAGLTIWFAHTKAERELGMVFTPFEATILAAYRWYRENGYL